VQLRCRVPRAQTLTARACSLTVAQQSIVLLSTWEPVRFNSVPDGFGSHGTKFGDLAPHAPRAARSLKAAANAVDASGPPHSLSSDPDAGTTWQGWGREQES